jgi:hypothetical protein
VSRVGEVMRRREVRVGEVFYYPNQSPPAPWSPYFCIYVADARTMDMARIMRLCVEQDVRENAAGSGLEWLYTTAIISGDEDLTVCVRTTPPGFPRPDLVLTPRKGVISDYPGRCTRCGRPAYVGALEVTHEDESAADDCPARRSLDIDRRRREIAMASARRG